MAQASGIEAISFDEVDRADFHELLKGKSSLWHKCVTFSADKVLVRVLPTSALRAETVAVSPDNDVFTTDGILLGPNRDLVMAALHSPSPLHYLLTEGEEEHRRFELQWEPPRDQHGNPFFLQKIEPRVLREIQSIKIEGPCEFKITEFGLRRGNLAGVEVAWGKTEFMGKRAIIAATRDSGGAEKISVNLAGNPLKTEGRRPRKK